MVKFRKPVYILTKLAILAVPFWYFLAAFGTTKGWWDFAHGMRTMSGDQAQIVGYICIAFGIIALLLSLLLTPRKPVGALLGAIAIAVPFIANMQVDKIRSAAGNYPSIHDVSTDPTDPPLFTQAIMSLREGTEGRVNPIGDYATKTTRDGDRVAELAAKGFPKAKTVTLPVDQNAAFQKALDTANAMGWEIINEDRASGIIEAVATTKWYGFKDDVVIRVRSAAAGSEIDLRSISRIGGRDAGKNGLRVTAYIEKLTG